MKIRLTDKNFKTTTPSNIKTMIQSPKEFLKRPLKSNRFELQTMLPSTYLNDKITIAKHLDNIFLN